MVNNLLKGAKLTVILPAQNNTTGAADTTGLGYVDMAGYDNVAFIGIPTEVIAGAVMGISCYTGDTVAALASSTVLWGGSTITTTDMEIQCWGLDIVKPSRRYLSAMWDKATQASGGSILAIQYNPTKLPAAQDATTTYKYGAFGITVIAGAT